MKRSVRLLMATAVASFALVAVPASPASASASCPQAYICAWEDSYQSGDMYVSRSGAAGRYEIDWWNGDNEISSIINKSRCKVTFYLDDAQSGDSLTVQPGGYFGHLDSYWNDDFESYMIWGCP